MEPDCESKEKKDNLGRYERKYEYQGWDFDPRTANRTKAMVIEAMDGSCV